MPDVKRGRGSDPGLAVSAPGDVHEDIIASMLRWSEEFVERPHAVVGDLPVCPFAKAARLNRVIQWEVRPFTANDRLDDDGELLTHVRDFSRDSTFETLFVVHPEPATVSSPELDALVARLNARLMTRPELSDLRAFDAHPHSPFQIGGLYTRRAPYPSFQILSHKLLTASSTSLLGSAYYDRFTPAMLSKVGMPRELSAEVKEH